MLKGFDENGNLKNVKISENGEICVKVTKNDNSSDKNIKVSENGEVYVKFDEKKEIETILAANVITVGTVAQKIEINKKITELSIANYSETANVTVEIGENSYIIGSNMAVDLPIGKDITNISLTSTEEETKVQYVVKGVE